ncbi:MAG: hypothetical protein V1853_00580 [bacterium]
MRLFRSRRKRLSAKIPNNTVIQRNPLFPGQVEKGRVLGKYRFFLIEVITVFVLLAYIILYSPLYILSEVNIKTSELSRLDNIDVNIQSLLSQKYLGIFPKDNYFLLRPNSFAQSIKDKFSNQVVIEKLLISKIFPNTLNIDIQERATSFLWKNSTTTFGLDNQGYLAMIISEQDPYQDLILFLNSNKINEQIGQLIISPDSLSKAVDFISRLEPLGLIYDYVNIPEFECLAKSPPEIPQKANEDQEQEIDSNTNINTDLIDQNNCNNETLVLYAREFQVYIDKGWYIYFSIEDLDNQIYKLETTLQDSDIDTDGLSYIDLRFGERVYYK